MSKANGINADCTEEGLTPRCDLDRREQYTYVRSQTLSELPQHPRDLKLPRPTEMDYHSTYYGTISDFRSPLATNIPYPDSPPREGDEFLRDELLGDQGFEQLLTQSDFALDNESIFKSIHEILDKQNPGDPLSYNAHSGDVDIQLEVPLAIAPTSAKGKQEMGKEPDVTSTMEDERQVAQDKGYAENLPSVPPSPSWAAEQQGEHVELIHTTHDAVTKPLSPPGPGPRSIHTTPRAQARRRSKGKKLPRAAPTTTSEPGGSGEPGRTGNENPPRSPIGQPQINSSVFLYYSSFEESERALRAHLNGDVRDDTVPLTDREKSALVAELFLAMTDTSLVPTVEEGTRKPQAIRSFEEGRYLDWQIQIVCWRVLEQCISRQQRGPIVPPWQRTRKPKDFECFRQRLDKTLEALKCEKQLCKRLMAPSLIDDFVDDPTSYVKRIQQNKALNDKKKDQIKLGRAAQAASSPTLQDMSSGGKARKRKTTDTVQAQPLGKRTRHAEQTKGEPSNPRLSESTAVPSQPLGSHYGGQNYSFPLDPTLTPQGRNEEWTDWINYGAILQREIETEGSPSPAFDSPSPSFNSPSPAFNSPSTAFNSPSPAFNPARVMAGGRLARRLYSQPASGSGLPTTNAQAPVDPHMEAPSNFPHPSQHAPSPQGSPVNTLSVEIEDHTAMSTRKRRKTTKS
ncbi:MAG: hypothetical protein M1839_005870 [Geoglossum umbratile]|nr:MAG: hypothetical protein M1839_005870 [Geoglossum umbratile]